MLYLLYGPDEFARSEALTALLATVPVPVADLNITRLDGRRLKLDTLLRACEALPFLAEHRLVIVTDLLKHQRAGSERDELRAYLERLPPTTDLVFLETDDFDKRNAVFTYLKKVADVREFQPLQGPELLRWVGERARAMHARIEPAAAQRLVEFAGADGRTLVNELTKLATCAGRGGRITADLVAMLVSDEHEQNLFAFVDQLSARRGPQALRLLHELLDDGQAPAYLLFMLARQVRVLIGVQELATRRMRPDEIAATLGQKPFVVRKALDQLRQFRPEELAALHDRVLELDHAVKTGRIEPAVALDLLVFETTAGMVSERR